MELFGVSGRGTKFPMEYNALSPVTIPAENLVVCKRSCHGRCHWKVIEHMASLLWSCSQELIARVSMLLAIDTVCVVLVVKMM